MAKTISFFIVGILILESRICRSLEDPNHKTSWENALIFDARVESAGFRSFQDVIDHLDYLKYQHVDAIWLGPVFPWNEHVYAVTNHTSIDSSLGGTEDFERLLEDARRYGIKCILVIMPYYTSDRHPWFQKWRQNESPFNDFYATFKTNLNSNQLVWIAERSKWCRKPASFVRSLDLSNQDLRRRLKKELFTFWLDKGVDGFYINDLYEAIDYPTESSAGKKTIGEVNKDYLLEIRKVVNDWTMKQKSEFKYLAVETDALEEQWSAYYGTEDSPGVLPINKYLLLDTVEAMNSEIATTLKDFMIKQLNAVPSNKSTTWILWNYRTSEIASKLGTGKTCALNMLSMLLPGQAYLLPGSSQLDSSTDMWCGYNLTSELAILRKDPVFRHGGYHIESLKNGAVIVLSRNMSDNPTYVVVCNFGDTAQTVNLKATFTDLQERLDIVLTSDTNDDLRALKVTSCDSVSVSPGAGTVLRSGPEGSESEEGERRRGVVSDETTEGKEGEGDTKDKDDKNTEKGAAGGQGGGNTGESGANGRVEKDKNETTVENVGKGDEGQEVGKSPERDDKGVEKRGKEGNGGDGDNSGYGANGADEKGKNDTTVESTGKGDEGRGVEKTTERRRTVPGEEDNDDKSVRKWGAGGRAGVNTSESGANGRGEKDKNETSVENVGKGDEGQEVGKSPERDDKGVEKRGKEGNVGDGDNSGNGANGADEKGKNDTTVESTGKGDEGRGVEKTTERRRTVPGEEDNDDKSVRKWGAGGREGVNTSESGANGRGEKDKNETSVENVGKGDEGQGVGKSPERDDKGVEKRGKEGNVGDGDNSGNGANGADEKGKNDTTVESTGKGDEGRGVEKTTERRRTVPGEEDNDDKSVRKWGAGGRAGVNTSESGANGRGEKDKNETSVENVGKGDEGQEVGKRPERDDKGVEKRGKEGNGGDGDNSGNGANGADEKGKNDTTVESTGKGDEGRGVEKTTERRRTVPGEEDNDDKSVRKWGAGGREGVNTSESGANGRGEKDKNETSVENVGKGDEGQGVGKSPERDDKGVEKRGKEGNVGDGDNSGNGANGADEKGKNDTTVESTGKGDEGRGVEKTTERRRTVPGEEDNDDKSVRKWGAGGREGVNTSESGANGRGEKDKNETSVENVGKGDEGQGVGKSPERDDKGVEKRGKEGNVGDGDNSGNGANGADEKGKNDTTVESTGKGDEGRGVEKTTERRRTVPGEEDNDDNRIGKGGAGGREGGNTSEIGKDKKGMKVNTDHGREKNDKKRVWGMRKRINQFWRFAAQLYSTYREKKLEPVPIAPRGYGQKRQ